MVKIVYKTELTQNKKDIYREETYTKRDILRENVYKEEIYIERRQTQRGYIYGVKTNKEKIYIKKRHTQTKDI